MDQPMPPPGAGRIQVTLPANIPFKEKWDRLKPVIEQLYVDENQAVGEIVTIMKRDYGFAAEKHDYKYHFKKWKLKKNIPTSKKEAMLRIRQQRTDAGKPTAFHYKGMKVDDNKLRRHVKESVRRDVARRSVAVDGGWDLRLLSGSAIQVSNSIFLNWNIPYGTTPSFIGQSPRYSASSPMAMSTPSDIVVVTPTNNASSPHDAPSPFSRNQNMKATIDRAHMLMGGQHHALVKSMRKEERDTMSTWLYQFWFHGFKTAKHWGRGPQRWTADLLGFDAIHVVSPTPVPASPCMDFEATNSQPERSSLRTRTVHVPSQLCHWSIHYFSDLDYEPLKSRTPSPEPNPDPLDERSWKDWPSSSEQQTCQERLLDSLARNDFSDIKTEDLPIAVPQLTKTLEGPNDRLLEEAFGFGIMARNANVLKALESKIESKEEIEKVNELNPFHLAASYLDGAKTCCSIFIGLLGMGGLRFHPAHQNKMGHTVFDNLMMAILKAHTSIPPGTVDDALRNEKRFPGEEVDICGRWDADSDCIRELFKAGDSCIPFAWKHKFCHTSVQVICHCILLLMGNYWSRNEAVPSGLFIKRCVSCGLKMQVQNLHTVVLTAFFLAHFGAKDEDLFGILAVLLTVLKKGANPLQTVDISIGALFHYEASNEASNADPTRCNHRHYTPLELANSVPSEIVENWSSKKRTGWEIFCQVLRLSGKSWECRSKPMKNVCMHRKCVHLDCVSGTRELAVLFGAVQAEYLTYRRTAEIDAWLSPNFDMDAIRECLERGEVPMIGFFENDMVHPVCECGKFEVPMSMSGLPRAQEIMKYHFSNLEDWSRTSFLDDYEYYHWLGASI
ncbi:hypothetical protein MMC29_006511 [Sticta canariensis]|nr:hypothetical protein [Sticta canariensis]